MLLPIFRPCLRILLLLPGVILWNRLVSFDCDTQEPNIFSFYLPGNIASLNSFDPRSIKCLVSVFSPFLMGGLLLLKVNDNFRNNHGFFFDWSYSYPGFGPISHHGLFHDLSYGRDQSSYQSELSEWTVNKIKCKTIIFHRWRFCWSSFSPDSKDWTFSSLSLIKVNFLFISSQT